VQSSYNAALFVFAAFNVIRNNTIKESYSTDLSAIAACSAVRSNADRQAKIVEQSSKHTYVSNDRDHAIEEEKGSVQSNNAAVSNTRDQAVKGKDQEIHEDDRDSDDNLDNLNTHSSYRNDEESCSENGAQTRTMTDDEQAKTSGWREDWNEEEEDEIRKINQRPTQNEDGNMSTELETSLAVPDWPWSSENAPLPGDYRPWPGNPPAGPNHAAVSNTQDQVVKGKDQEIHEDDLNSDNNLDNLDTLSSKRNDKKYEEEESWEENYTKTMSTVDEEQTKTLRWREDWNEEEEEEIRKMNQRSTQIEDGNGSTELETALAVPDWPWSAENAPLPGD
jgi:hypothetical protein